MWQVMTKFLQSISHLFWYTIEGGIKGKEIYWKNFNLRVCTGERGVKEKAAK